MKPILFLTLLTLGLATGLAAEDPAALLARIDDLRSVTDMDFEMTITSFTNGQVDDANTLWGWAQFTGGINKTLLAFVDPATVKGRKMLMDGPTVYLLFPKTRNPIRLSPLQVLLGQSSNGDVARTAFSADYVPASLTEGPLEGTPCWVFDLTAKAGHQGSSYRKVKLWVEKAGLKPKAADFYGSGEGLLKHTVYGDWRPVGDKTLAFQLDITDGTDPTKHTVLQYTRVGRQALAPAVFRRDYLESWSPEAPK